MIHVVGVVKNREDANKAIERLAKFDIKATAIQNGNEIEIAINGFESFCMATLIFDAMNFNGEFR